MTEREIKLISAICSDSHNWGVVSTEWDIATLHGAIESKVVPPHIYVYRECKECSIFNEVTPDYTIRTECGDVIDLYYLTQEGGEE